MKRRRSIGITFWGFIFVISGLMGVYVAIPNFLNLTNMSEEIFFSFLSYNMLAGAFMLMGGIGVLRLLNWARLLVICLCIIGIFFTLFHVRSVIGLYDFHDEMRRNIAKIDYPDREDAAWEEDRARKAPPPSFWITVLLRIAFLLCAILFFVHPRVKRQFIIIR